MLIRASLIALFTATASTAMPIVAPPNAEASADYGHLQPEKVADRVHVLRQPSRLWAAVVGNVTVIEQSDGLVLIDSGGSIADGRRVVELVRAISDKPVKAVALTHWHDDHPLGLAAIRAAWPGVRIVATKATAEATRSVVGTRHDAVPEPAKFTARLNRVMATIDDFQARSRDPALSAEERREYAIELAYIRSRLQRPGFGTALVMPTETFTEAFALPDRDAPVELRFLGRANTDGDAVAWLPQQRVLVTGDIVVAPTPYGFGSFPGDWIEVIGKLKAYDFAALIPGHGAPQADHAYLDKLIATLTDVRTQVGALAAQGLPLESVRTQVDYEAQTRAFVGDSPWGRLWFKRYWLDPITDAAYREAKGEPTIQGRS